MKTYLYLTLCDEPGRPRLYYVGSKTIRKGDKLNSDGTVVGYFGSSPYILKRKKWCRTRILRWIDNGQYSVEESVLIQRALRKYGAFFYGTCVHGVRRYHLDEFGKGFCLNCHWQSAAQISKEARIRANANQSKETRSLAAKKRWESGCYTTESFLKRNIDYTHAAERLNTEEAKRNSIEVRRRLGYADSAKKVAITISGKPHFVSKQIIAEFKDTVLRFSSIKEAENYFDGIGIHVTRATISQGLIRTNGVYNYKNLIVFRYEVS